MRMHCGNELCSWRRFGRRKRPAGRFGTPLERNGIIEFRSWNTDLKDVSTVFMFLPDRLRQYTEERINGSIISAIERATLEDGAAHGALLSAWNCGALLMQ